MSFDYNAPAELFLSKRTKSRRANIAGSRQRLRPFATPLRIYHHSVLSARGCRLAMSASAATTFSVFMKTAIIRCGNLRETERSGNDLWPLSAINPRLSTPRPGFQIRQ